MNNYLTAVGVAAALAGSTFNAQATPPKDFPTIASCERARHDRVQLNNYLQVYGQLLDDTYTEIRAGKHPAAYYVPGLRAVARDIETVQQHLKTSLEQCTADALASAVQR